MNARGLLILSLVVNVALFAALLRPKPPAPQAAPDLAHATPALPAAKPRTLTQVITNTVSQRFGWNSVESDDYKKYITNLRAIGCPEETIRDIIVADVNKLFEPRRKALRPAGDGFKFWKSGRAASRGPDEELVKQTQALAKERRDLLHSLLGEDFSDPQEMLAALVSPVAGMLDFLPPARQTQVLELEQRFAARLAAAAGQTNAAALAKTINAEKDAELNKLLTGDERETYELTTSRTASVMRSQLGEFDPTEQEFRDIFKARKKLDESFLQFSDPADPAIRDRREAALLTAYAEIHKSIGDARWNDYRAAREWGVGSPLRQIAEAAQIPQAEAMKVPDLRDAARAQAIRLRNDTTLTDSRREAALLAVQNETRAAILRVLGPTAGPAYLDHPATKSLFGEVGRPARP